MYFFSGNRSSPHQRVEFSLKHSQGIYSKTSAAIRQWPIKKEKFESVNEDLPRNVRVDLTAESGPDGEPRRETPSAMYNYIVRRIEQNSSRLNTQNDVSPLLMLSSCMTSLSCTKRHTQDVPSRQEGEP